jgi:hypothetical protein
MEKQITIALTSCGRWDLLEKTIKSLVQFWDGPKPVELLIYEDCGNEKYDKNQSGLSFYIPLVDFIRSVGWKISILGPNHIGQIGAIDFLYSKVKTPYIFHCEDDFEFFNTGFIQKSLSILEEKENIMQVWLRAPNDRNGHPCHGVAQKTTDGTKYHVLKTGYMGKWHGFSFNPGLRRLSDYQKLFPNGFAAEIPWNPKNPLESEILVGRKFFKNGFRAATLLDGYCRHIGGNGRHVKP